MKRTFLFISALSLVLLSCTGGRVFDVVDNYRLYASGVIANEEGTTLEGIDVSIKDFDQNLGETTSDNTGYFDFVAVKSNAPVFDIVINEFSDSLYATQVYRSFDTEILDLSLNETRLKQTASLEVIIQKTDINSEEFYGQLGYQTTFCAVLFSGINPPSSDLPCYELQYSDASLTDASILTKKIRIRSMMGSSAILYYNIGSNGEEISVEIPLTNNTNTYTIEY